MRLRSKLTLPGLGFVDGVLGALLTACVGLGVVWILGAVAVHSNGDVRYEVQRSEILSRLNKALPPSGPLLNALARFDPFPKIDGPEANVAPPAKGIGRDPQVRAAAASVVKILGTACGLGVEGSGWVARDGVVVTNAHVVAGQDDTKVLLRGTRAAARRDRDRVRPAQRPRGAARARAEGAPAAARRRAGAGHGRPRSSASRRTGPTTCAPARLGADAHDA